MENAFSRIDLWWKILIVLACPLFIALGGTIQTIKEDGNGGTYVVSTFALPVAHIAAMILVMIW
jgi:hypothetical protein